jgi:hypothetical protein
MTKIFMNNGLLQSLEGVVVSAVSKEEPSRRITKLIVLDNEKYEVEVVLSSDAPRIDAGEKIVVHYYVKDGNRYWGEAVEILGTRPGEVKFMYLGKFCKTK